MGPGRVLLLHGQINNGIRLLCLLQGSLPCLCPSGHCTGTHKAQLCDLVLSLSPCPGLALPIPALGLCQGGVSLVAPSQGWAQRGSASSPAELGLWALGWDRGTLVLSSGKQTGAIPSLKKNNISF